MSNGEKPAPVKRCFALEPHPNLEPSWGCCMCRVMNSNRRNECRNCDHPRCDLNPKAQPS